MRPLTTILLSNTLSAILQHIEESPDLDPDVPGLLEFKQTLLQRIQHLRNEDWSELSGPHTQAA